MLNLIHSLVSRLPVWQSHFRALVFMNASILFKHLNIKTFESQTIVFLSRASRALRKLAIIWVSFMA